MPGPAMVLIHGFGGNADHWRKSMPALSKIGPVYAIDLLGEFSLLVSQSTVHRQEALVKIEAARCG